MRRVSSAALAVLLAVTVIVVPAQARKANCHPAWKCVSPTSTITPTIRPTVLPTVRPTVLPTIVPTIEPTVAPTIVPTVRPTVVPTIVPTIAPTVAPTPVTPANPYTFVDEFNNSVVSTVWRHHFTCCGQLAGVDPTLTTESGGNLRMQVVKRVNGWYGDSIDTGGSFAQAYGYFEARVKMPKGMGLWPAFWLAEGWDHPSTQEIDVMEVCANNLGTRNGLDAGWLNTTIHFLNGSQSGMGFRETDLSLDYHVYAVDWRLGRVTWYLDNVALWTYSGANTPSAPMPVLFDLGVGGSWCGAPDSTTLSGSEMQVDWVHVRA